MSMGMVVGRAERARWRECCARLILPRKHDCLNRPGMKVVHTARSPGARAPPEAPSLATQCTSVRFEKTYRASQRTNLLESETS